MKHYISICADKEATEAKKIDLFEWSVLATLPEFAQKDKLDSMLVFNGYNDELPEYPRKESMLNKFSSIFIDCDNPLCDRDIIAKWKEKMDGYDYMIYETASSKPERPKFRAIIPLDGELEWNKEAKKAIFNIFKDFADDKASWFFSPTLDKLPTIIDHVAGRWYPCEVITNEIDKLRREAMDRNARAMISQILHERNTTFKHNPEGWRFLPSVKKCLEGLHVGERDSSLNAACYAMKQCGYKDKIPEFLDDVICDNEIKRKFRNRYR